MDDSKFIEYLQPNDDELDLLQSIISAVKPYRTLGSSHLCVDQAEREGKKYRDKLRRLTAPIADMYDHKSAIGVLVIDLISLWEEKDSIPPTPHEFSQKGDHVLTSLDIARCALIGAAGGYSYCFNTQANGTLSDDLFPSKIHENVIGFGAGKELGWHTEDASFTLSNNDLEFPTFDVISLCYLRNPNHDPTLVSKPDFSSMDESTLDALRKPVFVKKSGFSHQGDRVFSVQMYAPLIYGEKMMSFSFARIDEQRKDYEDAGVFNTIETFVKVLNAHKSEVQGVPGTIAFIDNMRVAYARNKWRIRPKFDGSDNWIRRLGSARNERKPFLETLMTNPKERAIDSDLLMDRLLKLSTNST